MKLPQRLKGVINVRGHFAGRRALSPVPVVEVAPEKRLGRVFTRCYGLASKQSEINTYMYLPTVHVPWIGDSAAKQCHIEPHTLALRSGGGGGLLSSKGQVGTYLTQRKRRIHQVPVGMSREPRYI